MHDEGAMAAKRRIRKGRKPATTIVTGPSADDAHEIVFFRRNKDDDPNMATPGREFLHSIPSQIRARFNAALNAVAKAPPKRFAGGGYWEAMHGKMTGWFELRIDGMPNRTHYRLFCLLDYEAQGQDKPWLVIIDGRSKPFRTTLAERDYAAIRALGDEYQSRNPRSWA